jgi:IS605 OrfB family transposase
VEKIAVGDLSDIREDENGNSRNWGASGNKKLHGWEFDRFTDLLEYNTEEHGILVDRVDEENTSKTLRADSWEQPCGAWSVRLCVVRDGDERGRERCGEHPTKDNSESPDGAYE